MHAGYLKTNCGSCGSQPQEVRDALGCNPLVSANQPAWQCQDGETVTSYFNCPRHFVPETVWNFSEVYQGYQRKRFALPAASEQPRKFLQMCTVYDSALSRFEGLRHEDQMRDMEFKKHSGLRIG